LAGPRENKIYQVDSKINMDFGALYYSNFWQTIQTLQEDTVVERMVEHSSTNASSHVILLNLRTL
jgi:hypothetical protein